MEVIVREAEPKDIPYMLQLIRELAEYERSPHSVINTREKMLEDGFGKQPIYKAFVAEKSSSIVGLALYYMAYSTWKGKIFYLEDIIVTEKERRNGIGKKLMDAVLGEAKQLSVNQIRWQVLEWNTPAIEFYKKMGVEFDPQWINCSMTKEAIDQYLVR